MGSVVPEPKSRARLAVGLVVLLPLLCACHTNFCGTAALLALEYVLGPSCRAGGLAPTPIVAAEANRVTAARKVLATFTSNMVAGVEVPMPPKRWPNTIGAALATPLKPL